MRRSGRTTRIIDAAVQTLFTTGRVNIKDHHYFETGLKLANKHAFDMLVGRLHAEHSFHKFKIDKHNFTVEILTQHP